MKKSPQELILPGILNQKAYQVMASEGLIKLDAMENPYPLPEALWADLAQAMRKVEIGRYPSSTADDLKDTLRDTFDISDDTAILLGNGSDELIQMVAMAVAKPGASLLSVAPTFSLYRLVAGALGMNYLEVELKDDFSLDLDNMLTVIEKEQPAVIFLSYPNNPTGNLWPEDAITAILEAAEGLVVIDEAYHAFAHTSVLDWIQKFDNLLVMRTLSKLGLAGARFGFLCGKPAWIHELDKVRLPYNVNAMTQCVVDTILPRIDLFEEQASDIVTARKALYDQLQGMDQLTVYPSEANFLLFKVDHAPALYQHLIEQGILVRLLHGSHRLLDNCLRVSIGNPDENKQFLAVLKAYFGL